MGGGLFLYFQVWDGAILVIYGVLVVSWWNYALYVYCHLCMLAKSNILEENPYAKYVVVSREKLCSRHMRTWSTWP